MLVNNILSVSVCNCHNHFFENLLCDTLPTVQKVANVFFHILTLGIPLILYHVIACIFPKKEIGEESLSGNPTGSVIPVEDTFVYISETFVAHCVKSIQRVTHEEVEEFCHRGGAIEIVDEGDDIHEIPRSDIYSTGCSSGVNRSQTMRAFLLNEQCDVRSVIAGGDSGANPQGDFHTLGDFGEDEQRNFTVALGSGEKIPQLGREQFGVFTESTVQVKQWYQDYFNNCEEYHFVTFSHSGSSVLNRLLKRDGRLEGFKITHLPWGDEINHPPKGSDFEHGSQASYRAFYDKIDKHIRIVD